VVEMKALLRPEEVEEKALLRLEAVAKRAPLRPEEVEAKALLRLEAVAKRVPRRLVVVATSEGRRPDMAADRKLDFQRRARRSDSAISGGGRENTRVSAPGDANARSAAARGSVRLGRGMLIFTSHRTLLTRADI
jgi:hypothetical protein